MLTERSKVVILHSGRQLTNFTLLYQLANGGKRLISRKTLPLFGTPISLQHLIKTLVVFVTFVDFFWVMKSDVVGIYRDLPGFT